MIGLSLSIGHRIVCRQVATHKPELVAPTPHNAVQGMEGMQVADEVLKAYGVVGMLVGGVAKELWQGHTDEDKLNAHKDVDVIVLSNDCRRHPKQYERGVDWWVSHNAHERPTNGNDVGLIWRVQLDIHAQRIPAGLYVCPSELLTESILLEKKQRKDSKVAGCRISKKQPTIFPLLDQMQLRWSWASVIAAKAEHCKLAC